MKLVLFDCDGTLVDSAGFIHDCVMATFADYGYPEPSMAETKSIIGLTLDKAIARLLERDVDVEITAMTARYKQHFSRLRAAEDFHEPVFPGIPELIRNLEARDDIILGVVTGKSRRGLGAVLSSHGFEHTFFTLRTADDCPSKPHPAMVLECCGETGVDPADTLVVGDAVFDMQMAVSAGATGIGVSWGYSSPPELRTAGAHAVIERPAELFDHIAAAMPAGE